MKYKLFRKYLKVEVNTVNILTASENLSAITIKQTYSKDYIEVLGIDYACDTQRNKDFKFLVIDGTKEVEHIVDYEPKLSYLGEAYLGSISSTVYVYGVS